jgi:hypothetical protein
MLFRKNGNAHGKEVEKPSCHDGKVYEGSEAASNQDKYNGDSGLQCHGIDGGLPRFMQPAEERRKVSFATSCVDEASSGEE